MPLLGRRCPAPATPPRLECDVADRRTPRTAPASAARARDPRRPSRPMRNGAADQLARRWPLAGTNRVTRTRAMPSTSTRAPSARRRGRPAAVARRRRCDTGRAAAGFRDVGVALRDEQQQRPASLPRPRPRTSDPARPTSNGISDVRKHHHVAQRQDGQAIGDVVGLGVPEEHLFRKTMSRSATARMPIR